MYSINACKNFDKPVMLKTAANNKEAVIFLFFTPDGIRPCKKIKNR
jgi:hypothetical protein